MDQRQYMQPYQMQLANMQQMCMQNLNRRVKVKLCDGQKYEGILEHVDDQHVYLIIEIKIINEKRSVEGEEEEQRFFGYPFGYGFGGFPYYGYPGFGYGRLILPLAALTALALL